MAAAVEKCNPSPSTCANHVICQKMTRRHEHPDGMNIDRQERSIAKMAIRISNHRPNLRICAQVITVNL